METLLKRYNNTVKTITTATSTKILLVPKIHMVDFVIIFTHGDPPTNPHIQLSLRCNHCNPLPDTKYSLYSSEHVGCDCTPPILTYN